MDGIVSAQFCNYNRLIPVAAGINPIIRLPPPGDWFTPAEGLAGTVKKATKGKVRRVSRDSLKRAAKAKPRGLHPFDYLTGGLGGALVFG